MPTAVDLGVETRLERGVTRRVVLLSLALACVFGYTLPVIDFKLTNTFLGAQHLPPGAVAVLLMLVLVVNPLLRQLSQHWRLSRKEALTVYITCLFSSLVPGHGSENFLIPSLLGPFYFATRENKWLDSLQPYLKPWLTPGLHANGTVNLPAVEGWYLGLPGGEAIPWGAWALPLVFWLTVILLCHFMLGCVGLILRAQWGEHEALAFPLLRLPLVMTEDLDRPRHGRFDQGFFSNKLMWCGFGIAVFIQALRGLHLYFPDVPDFPLGLDTGPLFTEAPWNQIGGAQFNIYLVAVGITYILTSEISFSLWFFYWFIKFQYIGAYLLGMPVGTLPNANGLPGKLFTGYQIGGCYLTFVAIVLWNGRSHFAHVALRAFGLRPSTPSERREMFSYPTAFWGFMGSFAALLGASWVAGVRLDIAFMLWSSYLVLAVGLTRVAVEGGMLALQHDISPLPALSQLLTSGPSSWLSQSHGLAPTAFLQSGIVDGNHMRGFTMPGFLHSFKLAYDHEIEPKPLLGLIVATILISLGISWWTIIHLGYDNGGLTLGHKWWAQSGPSAPVNFIRNMTKDNDGSVASRWMWLGVGAALTYGMMAARSRFLWFPLHPIGYLMSLTYSAHTFWSSIFLGWLAKVLVTRFGGSTAYRALVPAFLGLALGDVAMIAFWLVVDGWQGRTGHMLMPY